MINEKITKLLSESKTVAVVGLSHNPLRPSYRIAMHLLRRGYVVIPVNPGLAGWNGRAVYPDLLSVPVAIDIVNIFRRAEFVPEIVDQAIRIGAKAVWMQSGIINDRAAGTAERAGLIVVMNRCISVELAML